MRARGVYSYSHLPGGSSMGFTNLSGGYCQVLQTSGQRMCSNGRLAIETWKKCISWQIMSNKISLSSKVMRFVIIWFSCALTRFQVITNGSLHGGSKPTLRSSNQNEEDVSVLNFKANQKIVGLSILGMTRSQGYLKVSAMDEQKEPKFVLFIAFELAPCLWGFESKNTKNLNNENRVCCIPFKLFLHLDLRLTSTNLDQGDTFSLWGNP